MTLFKKVAIIGVGLIGGSLALAIRKRKLAGEVIGVSRHKETLLLAKENQAIDRGSQDIKSIKGADLVIFATPVNTILNLAPLVSKIINSDCIVTDVGSTKQEIVYRLEKFFPKFVGAHPLAGSQKRGIKNASPGIFQNSLCILTPTKNTDKKSLEKIRRLWMALGVRVTFLKPEQHDKVLSLVSHLPHVAAFSLMGAVPQKYLKFASQGLRDTTRIAASDYLLWSDILTSNQRNVFKAIELLQKELSRIRAAINKKDRGLLKEILKKAKAKRDSLNSLI